MPKSNHAQNYYVYDIELNMKLKKKLKEISNSAYHNI